VLQQMFELTSTRFHAAMQCRRSRHWSTASSIIVDETRERVGGYHHRLLRHRGQHR